MARDEWPMLGLAITHALMNVVDHVVVVDHGSIDDTAAGLVQLCREWNGRLTVISLQRTSFFQDASAAVILAAVGASKYDWIYVFDADEFLLAEPIGSLKLLLSDLPENVQAIRYELQQWIAPYAMRDQRLEDYFLIVKRAMPCVFTSIPGDLIACDIEAGFSNFFDYVFPSKVIARARHASMLTAGAHSVENLSLSQELLLDADSLRVAHIPMLSRDRLLLKCQQGRSLQESGFPSGHGWQSQMLHRLEMDGRLDAFWWVHSDHQGCALTHRSAPVAKVDLALRKVLMPAVNQLSKTLSASVDSASTNDPPCINLDAVIAVVHSLRVDRAACVYRHDQAITERDQAIAERDQAIAERDQAIASRASLMVAVSGWRGLAVQQFNLLSRVIGLISRRLFAG